MSASKACLAILVCALFWPTSPTAADASTVRYELHIACPAANGFTFSTDTSVYGCPVRAVDQDDMMGDPSLAVDPLEPKNLIIGSLHGGVSGGGSAGVSTGSSASCDPGPSQKSRCGQIFTTFTSQDAGAYWTDNPYFPPKGVEGAYGEHPQVTIDPYGHVFVGSLYAVPTGNAFRFVIGAQKFDSLGTINDQQSNGRTGGTYNLDYIDPVYKGGAIGQFWFLFNPVTDNMTMVWYETPGKLNNLTAPPAPNCIVGPPAPCIPPPAAKPRPAEPTAPSPPGTMYPVTVRSVSAASAGTGTAAW
ncbi:MAG: hypothetical protein ABR562_08260 [Thermoplasmatota archaeon]